MSTQQELDDRGEVLVSVTPPTPVSIPVLDPTVVGAAVRVPGPITVGSSPQKAPTTNCKIIINNLMPSIQLMLGPLGFLFCVLSVVTKIIDCVNAVPKCVIQLSPAPILAALEGLAKAIACLARLVPQLSMLYMIYDILVLLLTFLDCTISALTSIKAALAELAAAIAEAEANDDQYLKDQLVTAQANSNTMADQTFATLNPLGPIFAVISMFLPLFGQPTLSFTTPAAGTPIDTVLAVLQPLRDTLAVIKTALGEIIGG